MFVNESRIYGPNDIKRVLDEYCAEINFVSTRNPDAEKRIYYLNCPVAFDIETSSIIKDDTKLAFMYHWQFGINGAVIFGRTWQEWVDMCHEIKNYFNLDSKHRILCFIHNASYEFQFMRKWFDWDTVFSVDERKPVKAVTKIGIEFRCSLILSGYSLAKVGENLQKYKIQKMKGDLDYSKIRHYKSPLDEAEQKYCENDVRVVMSYIQNKIEEDGNIAKILLTKTSYVRKYVRDHTIYNKDKDTRFKYKKKIRSLTLEVEEYIMARRAFMGGFTHGNARYIDKEVENADSFDFTSSYPAVMIAFPYPMSKGRKIIPKTKEEQEFYINHGLSIIDIKFKGLCAKPDAPDNIISLSKCYNEDGSAYSKDDAIINNGRVVIAFQDIYMTITNIDLDSINQFYDYDSYEVIQMYHYTADYLPKPFIECIIYFYKLKTELKGVPGKEAEYAWAKEMLNSLYGMCVTDICKDDIEYDVEWSMNYLTDVDLYERINKYNDSQSRFLSYVHGVFVTAYARRNVYTGILEFGIDDYLYCDTDSNKVINADKHMDYIEDYNKWIIGKLEKTFEHYNLDKADIAPLDTKGEAHPLGVWDWETKGKQYLKFKTLGAKRYLVKQKDGYHMTVAGLPKSTVDSMLDKYGDKIFDNFNNGLIINPEETTKNCLTYVDAPCRGTITDYLGNEGTYDEKSYIHVEAIGFEFSRDKAFIDYLTGIKQERSYAVC